MSAGDAESRPPPDDIDPLFTGDSEVGRALARVDWAATPIGEPSGWPQNLRTTVDIVLTSRFSMWMAWGPELTFFCNDAYRNATLRDKYPWALGRPTREVWSEIWADIADRIEQVMTTGQATWDEALPLVLKRSGYPEETYHTFSYSPLHDDAGQVAGVLCVVREDTGRVIAERRMAKLRALSSDLRAVRTEEETLKSVGSQLGPNRHDLPFTLIYLLNADGSARLAASSGIDAGHPAAPATLPADGGTVWPLDELQRGEPMALDPAVPAFRRLPTGAWPEPPTEALLLPLLRQGGGSYGFLIVGLNRYRRLDDDYREFLALIAAHISADIAGARAYQAELHRAEELAELDRAKTDFFTNVSHEFRTPLSLIAGPVSGLRDRLAGVDEAAIRELEIVQRNVLRLTKLVDTLLDFSRIEASRMEAHYEPVDFAAFTAELAGVFQSAADQAGLALIVECDPLDEPVYVDRDMWEKVMFNLLSNALKFTFRGAITVRVRRDGAAAEVTVRDTGIGIAEVEMPRLFERFHRAGNVGARSAEGSGIGLALSRELVALHGGSITADSTEGVGTTLAIRLPFGTAHLPADAVVGAQTTSAVSTVADAYVQEALRWLPEQNRAAPAAVEPDEGLESSNPTGPTAFETPPRVLVVDDNADMREYLTRLLCDAGYRVRAVDDGLRALTSIRDEVPDLVVSDVMMPGLDGLELAARLRTDTRTVGLPVLLLSARAGPEAAVEGLESGADDYLVKPFDGAELLARVRTNIELSRLRMHYAEWRAALVDSLQEAVFVCDEHGTVIEINAAFTEILGYGPENLPYQPRYPWWPDADTDPEADQLCAAAFDLMISQSKGSFTIPVRHRDGHQVWIAANFKYAEDPDRRRRALVGALHDVTAEHHAAQRQEAMAALNAVLARADTVDDALRGSMEELRRLWQARRVLALTSSAPATPGEPEMICSGLPATWSALPARARHAIETLSGGEMLNIEASADGTAGIALRHPDGVSVVVIWIELVGERRFSFQEQTLLTMLAGRLGQGLLRVQRIDQQREAALALQRAILGPAQPEAGIVTRYEPATRPLQVGGDWYDVIKLDDNRLGLVVGDCVGHGLAAAAIMGQLRSACRALLMEQPSPAAALANLDRFAALLPGAECTTVFCAILTPRTGELRYSSAGHPPPILIGTDRSAQLLDGGQSIPIGVHPDRHRSDARVTIPARGTLLLYTDGLIERRGEVLDNGIERAMELTRTGSDMALDALADRIVVGLTHENGYEDDVALLLYRQPAPLDIDFPAELGQLRPTRAALRDFLNRAGLPCEQTQDILVAAGEAVTNAIEHGHHQNHGTINLHAAAAADQVSVTVTDTGTWRAPHPQDMLHRGRGISLMRALVDGVRIQPSATGTTVQLRAKVR